MEAILTRQFLKNKVWYSPQYYLQRSSDFINMTNNEQFSEDRLFQKLREYLFGAIFTAILNESSNKFVYYMRESDEGKIKNESQDFWIIKIDKLKNAPIDIIPVDETELRSTKPLFEQIKKKLIVGFQNKTIIIAIPPHKTNFDSYEVKNYCLMNNSSISIFAIVIHNDIESDISLIPIYLPNESLIQNKTVSINFSEMFRESKNKYPMRIYIELDKLKGIPYDPLFDDGWYDKTIFD